LGSAIPQHQSARHSRSARETFASDADLLADTIVTRSGKEDGSTAFLKDEAQSGIRAFLMHIMTSEPEERRTLTTLVSSKPTRGEIFSRVFDLELSGLLQFLRRQVARRSSDGSLGLRKCSY
jgi:hypothetical protein